MNIRCTCGSWLIAEGAPGAPAGCVLRQQDYAACYETSAEEVAEFIQTILDGRRREWMEEFYSQRGFDLHDANVIYDLLTRRHARSLLRVYQCPDCGTLAVEREPNSLTFRFFTPEAGDWRGALTAGSAVSAALVESVTFAEDRRPWWKACLKSLRRW